VFYLGYVLGSGRFSLLVFAWFHSFYRTGDTVATQSITDKTLPTKQKLLELAYTWIGFAEFYICTNVSGTLTGKKTNKQTKQNVKKKT